jgi:REP element-mobilizing transposase RayT
MKPIYTSTNCKPAYQLRWSLALFCSVELPSTESWVSQLADAIERDGVRLLDNYQQNGVLFFLLSTRPSATPPQIVKSVKGRLQHILQDSVPKAFRRNFSLSSVGEARREIIEEYVASQLGHHPMADPRVEARFKDFQFVFPRVDLSAEQFSSHGRYVYCLHIALVHEARWREIREEQLSITRDMFFKAARQKGHRISRLALLPDHLHATLGCGFNESPEEVALGYMNNLAFAHGMKPIFCYSYYVGTFGDYDMGAIRRRVTASQS